MSNAANNEMQTYRTDAYGRLQITFTFGSCEAIATRINSQRICFEQINCDGSTSVLSNKCVEDITDVWSLEYKGANILREHYEYHCEGGE